ncbi:hypothetical protein [Bowmanella sp. JS7-9]|uniref:Uncharacterized protein n=1 Tax=Pseudobowmanella zhangzhouensis TaxID=1537679 RepID=A0ABW1XH20_9ALTE|nr:hypothetical protein [Bowmanella sp. JS7-9]
MMRIWPALLLLLNGCATQGVDRASQNQIIQQFYAQVVNAEPVKLASHVKTGMLIGGVSGFLDELDGNSEDMIAGGLVGLLFGGLFTAIAEGDDDATQYQLYSPEYGEFSFVQKEWIDITSGCVKVSRAEIDRLSTAEPAMCEFDNYVEVE